MWSSVLCSRVLMVVLSLPSCIYIRYLWRYVPCRIIPYNTVYYHITIISLLYNYYIDTILTLCLRCNFLNNYDDVVTVVVTIVVTVVVTVAAVAVVVVVTLVVTVVVVVVVVVVV